MVKKWMQKVAADIKKRGTTGVFTRAKLKHDYPDTTRGTTEFANAVLKGKIKGMDDALWHRRAALAKTFVKAGKRDHREHAKRGGRVGSSHAGETGGAKTTVSRRDGHIVVTTHLPGRI